MHGSEDERFFAPARATNLPAIEHTHMSKPEIRRQSNAVLLLFACFLSGCSSVSPSLIPLDGSPVNDPSKVALITEDTDYPLLLRGLDGIPLKTMRVPNAFHNYAYIMKSGPHTLWLRDVPYGHPVFASFEKAHCYVMEVELVQGMKYRLREDVELKKALLIDDATGQTIAMGELVDEPWIPARGCRWR